jgi:hypothetical protein
MAGLIVSNGAVAFASHLGGSLTHGEDYLTEYLPMMTANVKKDSVVADTAMLVYRDVLMPVFEAKCVSCHNESRSKGEFSMVSIEKIIKGGESGNKGFIAGNADSSEVYKRIVLPEYHEDRMPPEGKAPMTTYETTLLKHWIDRGADMRVRVKDLRKDSVASVAVTQVLPDLDRYKRKQEIAKVKDERLHKELQQLAFRLNIIIEKDSSADENMYTVSMKFPPAPLGSEQLRELAPYGPVFSKLSLVASGIEDEGLYHISMMPNVKALFLQKTGLKGSGLVHLKNMEKLEVLNLSYTKVDDRSSLELLKIPALREVYLFQSNTSPEVAKALQAYKPVLKVLLEEGPYW